MSLHPLSAHSNASRWPQVGGPAPPGARTAAVQAALAEATRLGCFAGATLRGYFSVNPR